jgi:hypothetical protein
MQKISPLKAAREDDGTQKLVPRSAVVERLGDGDSALPELPPRIDGQAVDTGLEELVAYCRQALSGINPALDDAQREQLGAVIESAAQTLRVRLADR